jgi:membrane associated rhomboid family serine protease
MNAEIIMAAHITLLLLAANVGVSIAGFANPRLVETLIFDLRAMRERGEWWRMVTSGFVHADPFHLFMNALTLFFIGPYVEYLTGPGGMLLIYFGSLLGGSAWSLMDNWRAGEYRALGASGATSGVTTAFALFAPFTWLMIFFIPMPAIVFAVVFIGWSAWASGRVQDGIGHGAHLGGALMGVVLVCLFWPAAMRNLWAQLMSWLPV